MTKILIHVEGGVIQNIQTDGAAEVYIIDKDIEGVELDHPHLTWFDGEECLLSEWTPEHDPHSVHLAAKTWKTT